MKAIVVGADGTIGTALFRAFEQRGDTVYGTTRRRALVGAKRPYLDLAADDLGSTLLPDADVVFFCAAIVSYAECRLHPEQAQRVNVTNPAALARRLIEKGARVVLLSTNAVFDGREPKVPALRPTCPISVYGKLASEAEQKFAALGDRVAIARLTKLVTAQSSRFLDWINSLSRGQDVTAVSDLCMSPISFDDVIPSLLAIADARDGDIYQVSGADDISYHEAARHVASRLGADPDLVRQDLAHRIGIPQEEIMRFSSLDASRIAGLTGRSAPHPQQVLDRVFGDLFDRQKA